MRLDRLSQQQLELLDMFYDSGDFGVFTQCRQWIHVDQRQKFGSQPSRLPKKSLAWVNYVQNSLDTRSLRRRHAGVHQCSSRVLFNVKSTLYTLTLG